MLSRFCCSLFLFLFHYCCFFSVCTYLCLCCITFLLLYKPVSAPFSDSCLCVSVCVFVIACMVMFLFVLLFLLLFEEKFFGRNQSREMKRNLGRNKNGICAHFYLALEKKTFIWHWKNVLFIWFWETFIVNPLEQRHHLRKLIDNEMKQYKVRNKKHKQIYEMRLVVLTESIEG